MTSLEQIEANNSELQTVLAMVNSLEVGKNTNIVAGTGITAEKVDDTVTISTNYEFGTEELTSGSSVLASGKLYFCYE